ncbi:hypothetical protein BALOs_1900 [Halobacteriovorax sp. BALOs_7]|uniref:Uncharacterized protein n=1 Tax=Halobacteriovorax vibrionivorans TaxID=2152716 RepID=A0ABY0IDD7_9BACT|nr:MULTISPECIES: hypothetical protein [Halobacteriovorax]AYF44900.1 hypothetical protein BALOs_1900 [Halobacteriovorax sp. BALOs_7]RZF20972.1 hypothetical protein DAY19_13385 [Halobacteriovorax vibrionivorans]TGD46793.1 hypothetical protein EP118_10725 [Halobacteriovorax sp. Y22]
MKYFLIITLFFIFMPAQASAQTILLCLGKEESFYAKKHYTGPKYHLNQIMINEISSVGNPELAAGNYKKYCTHPEQSPSLKLLKAMTLGKKGLFNFKEDEGDAGVQFAMVTYDEFRKKSIKVLMQYMSKIQMQAASADCLTKNIPGLTQFYSRFRYLEEEIDSIALKGSKEDLLRLYDSLENIDQILKKCQKKPTKAVK